MRYLQALSLLVLSVVFTAASAETKQLNIGPAGLQVSLSPDTRISLRVAGPDNVVHKASSNNGQILWQLPAGSEDGHYRYDLYTSTGPVNAQGQGDAASDNTVEHGDFEVEAGVIQLPVALPDLSRQETLWQEAFSDSAWLAVKSVLDAIVPAAQAGGPDFSGEEVTAQDYNVVDTTPAIRFNSTFLTNQLNENLILINDSRFEVQDRTNSNTTIPLRLVHSGNNEDSFVSTANGDVELVDGAMYILRSNGHVGVGTTTPEAKLHVLGSFSDPQFRIADGFNFFEFSLGAAGLWISSNTPTVDSEPLIRFNHGAPENSLVVNTAFRSDGNVGLFGGNGSDVPQVERALHIRRSDDAPGSDNNTAILVENTSAVTRNRTMLELVNNGNARIVLNNTANGARFEMGTNANAGNFIFIADGEPIFTLTPNGRVLFGIASNPTLDVFPNGNGIFRGTVTATDYLMSSDVNEKQDIEEMEGNLVLAKLEQLPVTEWAYKKDPESRHIGPMAQDFKKVFNLGTDETKINPADMAGVSLAAVKALKVEKDTQIKAMAVAHEKALAARDAEIAALKARFAALEAKLIER